MKDILWSLLLLTTLVSDNTTAFAQGTAFTYQGRLSENGNPAHGSYDLRFIIYDSAAEGNALAGPLTNAVNVTNGLFTVLLDFGLDPFTGANRWLEVGVRTNGGTAIFDSLMPRQQVTPTPYAISARTLSGSLGSQNLAGAYSNALTFNNSANQFRGSFIGNGASLSNIAALTLGGLGAWGFWQTAGNAETTASTHFLGTTDNQPLELKVNRLRALRLEPAGDSANFPDGVPDGAPHVIGGAPNNLVIGRVAGATISGGGATNHAGVAGPNTIAADYASIGGGLANTIQTFAGSATISGGEGNRIQSDATYAAIGGGYQNVINAGAFNTTIGGGNQNIIQSDAFNVTIGGGNGNVVASMAAEATISGGLRNTIETGATSSTIAGGRQNAIEANAYNATIGGGLVNRIQGGASDASIGGGEGNRIQTGSLYATIAGGRINTIQRDAGASTISGGNENTVQAGGATIGGGWRNVNGGGFAVIGGGDWNTVRGTWSMIGGGYRNMIETNAQASVVGGGTDNMVEANTSSVTIAGGAENKIHNGSSYSTIGGGLQNRIQGIARYATIPGGAFNIAHHHAFAAGTFARAIHSGAFVWSDAATFDVIPEPNLESATSTNANSVTMRASGGYRLFTSTNGSGVFLAAGGGAWTSMSDRNAKENFEPVDSGAVLEKVVSLPLTTWNYKSQTASVRHMGPVAQDFKAAFGVGESDTGINTIDADGVALAAIQGLNQKLDNQLKAKEAELQALKKRMADLERIVAKLHLAQHQP